MELDSEVVKLTRFLDLEINGKKEIHGIGNGRFIDWILKTRVDQDWFVMDGMAGLHGLDSWFS